MVRKRKQIPPVYSVAIGALVALYSAEFIPVPGNVLCGVFWIVLVLIATVSALRSLPAAANPVPASRSLIVLCAACGVLIGLGCSYSARMANLPLKTLAKPEHVSVLRGRLLADPVPYGSKYYRAPFLVSNCSRSDGASFSASGSCTVYIPYEMVRASLPGGIGTDHAEPVLFSAGLNLSLTGKFGRYRSTEGESFFANGIIESTVVWNHPADSVRASLRLALMRILYDWKDAGGFLLALLSANRDYLSSDLASDFRVTGLSHILALSGMHLSLMGLIAIRIGKRFGGKRMSIRLSFFAIIFFVWFAGLSPSLNRALVMALLMLAVRFLGLASGVLPVLAFTAIFQMMMSPQDALSLAYMLSYAALWGILTIGDGISYMLAKIIPRPFSTDLGASIGAQAMTAPIISCFIGVLAPVGIIASCLVSAPSSFFLVAGMLLTAIAAIVPPFAHFCGLILDAMYRLIAVTVHFFAQATPLSINGLPATIIVTMVSVAAGLVCMGLSAACRKRRSSCDSFARL